MIVTSSTGLLPLLLGKVVALELAIIPVVCVLVVDCAVEEVNDVVDTLEVDKLAIIPVVCVLVVDCAVEEVDDVVDTPEVDKLAIIPVVCMLVGLVVEEIDEIVVSILLVVVLVEIDGV